MQRILRTLLILTLACPTIPCGAGELLSPAGTTLTVADKRQAALNRVAQSLRRIAPDTAREALVHLSPEGLVHLDRVIPQLSDAQLDTLVLYRYTVESACRATMKDGSRSIAGTEASAFFTLYEKDLPAHLRSFPSAMRIYNGNRMLEHMNQLYPDSRPDESFENIPQWFYSPRIALEETADDTVALERACFQLIISLPVRSLEDGLVEYLLRKQSIVEDNTVYTAEHDRARKLIDLAPSFDKIIIAALEHNGTYIENVLGTRAITLLQMFDFIDTYQSFICGSPITPITPVDYDFIIDHHANTRLLDLIIEKTTAILATPAAKWQPHPIEAVRVELEKTGETNTKTEEQAGPVGPVDFFTYYGTQL